MKNIEKLKRQYIGNLAKKNGKKIDDLTDRELRTLSPPAEFWAYKNLVIPDGFGAYSIFDFNGYAINKKDNSIANTLSSGVSLIAKDKICRYCWGLTWEEISRQQEKDKNSMRQYFRDHQIMMKRYENGDNIVIFGQSQRPIGRTMLASIVMKEALRLRVSDKIKDHSYDWVDFSKLFVLIEKGTRKDNREEEETMELTNYSTCDWLVVDNIQKKARSDKQTTLISDLIDPFFLNRYERKQPTILVFKFDIRDKHFDMEKTFGIGIGRILESRRTFKIPLSENLLS